MVESAEIPDCVYSQKPILIKPCIPNKLHNLPLSNLDDQKFLRFSIKYFYLFKKLVTIESLKISLSRVLVDYYPLAGRLKVVSPENEQKLQVECNGEGALFVEANLDLAAEDFNTQTYKKPNKSWKKLLYRVESCFMDAPLLIVQATTLRCGGMILCTAINHCLCDGIGSSQFLNAWAHFTRNPTVNLPISPFHFRHILRSRNPPQVTFPHPTFTKSHTLEEDSNSQNTLTISRILQFEPIVASSTIFTQSQIFQLKKLCAPLLKCSTFDILASHTWRCWLKSLDISPPSMKVKLLFSVNVRKHLNPEIPQGYYGNAFVLACAESTVTDVLSTDANLRDVVKLVQHAKSEVGSDDYVRSVIDCLEDESIRTDTSCSLVISQWGKFGLEDLDFGSGKAMQMGPVTSDIYCLFLPVIGDDEAVRVLVSVPESVVYKFEHYMMDVFNYENNGGNAYVNGH